MWIAHFKLDWFEVEFEGTKALYKCIFYIILRGKMSKYNLYSNNSMAKVDLLLREIRTRFL